MNFEDLSGNQLVELFGAPELMGRSFLKRVTSRTTKFVKKNPLQSIAAVGTGGLSLLATKGGRNAVGSSARFIQKKGFRPVAHQVANVARNPAAQSFLMNTASSFIPGGSAALTAANLLKKKVRTAAAPFASMVPPSLVSSIEREFSQPPATGAQPSAHHKGMSMPMMLGVAGVGLAGLLLVVSMKKKKS